MNRHELAERDRQTRPARIALLGALGVEGVAMTVFVANLAMDHGIAGSIIGLAVGGGVMAGTGAAGHARIQKSYQE